MWRHPHLKQSNQKCFNMNTTIPKDSKVVEFTPEKVAQFYNAYQDANEVRTDTFIFEGNEYFIKYAYYLLQYLFEKFEIKEEIEKPNI